jgi:hypothetical protein
MLSIRVFKKIWQMSLIAGILMVGFAIPVIAFDSKETQLTLTGLQGVYVIVEELQSNIIRYEKYLLKSGLSKEQIQQDVEQQLRKAGIRVLTPDEWTKTPGKPLLYVNINTYEHEKYWLAYDISINLHQLVSMESNPKIRTLASTWSMNVTGIANIGTLTVIRNNILYLVDRFIGAYKAVNNKR